MDREKLYLADFIVVLILVIGFLQRYIPEKINCNVWVII
jgi:hypothetical protein